MGQPSFRNEAEAVAAIDAAGQYYSPQYACEVTSFHELAKKYFVFHVGLAFEDT